MKSLKRMLTVPLTIAVVLIAIFLAGRYGWKLGGFRACQGAGVSSVEVSETAVHITGFYPGSFPEGFCGYYAEERDGKLYAGFRFSAVFGFFETGDFDITIPIRGEITEVILKTSMNETSLWRAQTGFLPQSEQYGVYVKLERNGVYSLSMSCENFGGGMHNADFTACVKSTSYNMAKAGYTVRILSDCITSYDKKKLDEMLAYYQSKGCLVEAIADIIR